VWGSVDDEQLRTILREAIDCRIAVEVILERALGAGAPDNASLVVAHCVAMPGR
jgi:serine/threonine protein phosphatase PrpC